jgi:hypothetical protein
MNHPQAHPDNEGLDEQQAPPGVDPAIPSPARLYDYYLGAGCSRIDGAPFLYFHDLLASLMYG